MSLRKQDPGHLTIIEGPSSPRLQSSYLDQLKSTIDSVCSQSALLVLAEQHEIDSLKSAIHKRLGQRRSTNLTVTTPFHLLCQLQGQRTEPSPGVRARLTEELAEASQSVGELLEAGTSLDALVAEDSESPLALAYRQGLNSMGFQHPYADFGASELPVSITAVFAWSLQSFPEPVQRWLLRQLDRGIEMVATHPNPDHLFLDLPPSTVVERLDVRPSRLVSVNELSRVYPNPGHEYSAIIEACKSHAIDTVFCASRALQRDIELDFVLQRIPYRAPSLRAITNSESINALVAYLEWLLNEEETALHTLLRLIGSDPDKWPQYARKRDLSRKLSVGALLVDDRDDAQDHLTRCLPKLASLILNSRIEPSDHERLQYFVAWGDRHIPSFDRGLLDALIDRSGITDRSSSLHDLRRSLYQALFSGSDDCIAIAVPGDPNLSPSKRAWLAMGETPPERLSYWRATLTPLLRGELTISTVQAG